MANTGGGALVLGMDPEKKDGHTVRYQKNGYDKGTEDKVGLDISHRLNNVDPISKYEPKPVYDGVKYFVVLRIISEDLKKPYAVKGSGKFFVRVGSSSEPASRSTVINLFSGLREKIHDVSVLK